MKKQWWVTVGVTALLALTTSVAVAKDDQNHGDDQNRGDERNHGQYQRDENHGQRQKQYRRFNENQRQYAHTYYDQNQNQQGFRQDNRWNNDYENRLQPGYVFDDDMRRMSRPAPYEMTRGMGR